MSAILDLDQCKVELDAVIASGIFAKAPSLALLLEYVCAKYFEGQANQIKEYNIAVEALGRPPSFDPRQDSIVRVEAFRLRKRLKQFYEKEGAERPLQIVIPSGQYVPQFVTNLPAIANGNGHCDPVMDESVALTVACPAVDRPLAFSAAPPEILPGEQRRPTSRRQAALMLGVPLAAILAGGVWYFRSQAPPKETGAPRLAAVPLGSESEEVRIACGSPAGRLVDRLGNVWMGDRFFRGGSVFATPGHSIWGTSDPELFRSQRQGDFTYDIPLRPGVYELHLYFAETLYGENNTAGGGESSRLFRVTINDKLVLSAFDVISDAGGSNTADERVFKDVSPAADGMLHVRFAGLVNNVPFLNALEVVPGIPGKMRPIRILARPRNYADSRGRLWGADRYFSHGTSVPRSEPVANTPDPEIFQGERFGNFRYVIPVADGHYTVTLHFAETWFGPGKPGGGGQGSRLFDLYCNGVALLRNFDIYRAAGGPQRATEKSFRGITPNAQGKIVLSFVPVVNYACVNAIEVVDDGS